MNRPLAYHPPLDTLTQMQRLPDLTEVNRHAYRVAKPGGHAVRTYSKGRQASSTFENPGAASTWLWDDDGKARYERSWVPEVNSKNNDNANATFNTSVLYRRAPECEGVSPSVEVEPLGMAMSHNHDDPSMGLPGVPKNVSSQ